MDKKVMMVSLLVVMIIFYCSGIAIGDGGGPESTKACKSLPSATAASPLITGSFTAAYDKSQCSIGAPEECRHYNIHFVLEMPQLINGEETVRRRLFSFPMGVCDKSICSYEEIYLKKAYKAQACNLEIGKAFGLGGVPVLTDISVTDRDFCDSGDEGMLAGRVKIRVVPKE